MSESGQEHLMGIRRVRLSHILFRPVLRRRQVSRPHLLLTRPLSWPLISVHLRGRERGNT
ncbi:hypothetical protein E2C01_024663 [Portunus trituberculatus]|uniref:Uncharacterized protein n=1 Tax=Portunus trituberculatus TaxID=210409 RepID=A0A5B7EDH2_PORTR|nr:hypothetical protein [Portunus trituberculatus]